MMPQQLNTSDDTILTERKAANAVIASRTEWASTLIALDHCRILEMIGAIHH